MNIANKEELVKNENPGSHEQYVEVPRGWNRCLESGSIVYFSPSKICLRSKEDVASYLISDRTCKCGLDCPLYIDKVFNFDPSLKSHPCMLTKLENDHKTLCQETIKARFVTLAQTQPANESSEQKESKAGVIRKKPDASVTKRKIETQVLPSFETFVSLSDATQNQETKPNKPRRPGKKKNNVAVTAPISVSKATAPTMPTCQTVHTNTAPILHSSVEMQNSSVSTGAVFSSLEHVHSKNVGPLFTFSSAQLNASSFLAALSSATTIPSHIRPSEANHSQKVHPLRPLTTKSTVEHAPVGQKVTAFPSAANQPNNLVYLPSTGNMHPVPIPNSKVNWSGASGLPLPRFTTSKTDKGGFTMKGKQTAPKMVYPYPITVSSVQPTMSSNAASSAGAKVQLKQHDLAQLLQNQQTAAISSIIGRTEPSLSGHQTSKVSNADKHNTRTVPKPADPLSQPLQYCGILLQPGMVPQVQFPGAGTRSNVSLGNNQDQNPGGNLYTLQGLSYGSNVGNPVLGITPNTVIPYFLGIAQPSTVPKPIVPATTSACTTKDLSPTSSTAPLSTSAIAAAYSAFVSIAPASVTNSSFSQQLVNLVSNYNNPYWQHLLTQGANSNTLAYQLMQIGQYNARQGLLTQTTKSPPGKNLCHTQTKLTTSSSKSVVSIAQESKTKTTMKDLSSVSAPGSVAMNTCTIRTTPLSVATTSDANVGKGLRGIVITSNSSCSTVDTSADGDTKVVSSDDSLKEKTVSNTGQYDASANDMSVTSPACTTDGTVRTPSFCSSAKITSTTDNLVECMDLSDMKTFDSSADSKSVVSVSDISSERFDSASNEAVNSDSLEKTDSGTKANVVATENDNSAGESFSNASETVSSASSTKRVDGANREALPLLSHISPENGDYNRTESNAVSNNILEDVNPCASVETSPLPQSKSVQSDNCCEMYPGVSDTTIRNARETCRESDKGNTITDMETSRDIFKDSISKSVTVDCSTSSIETTDAANVCIDSPFVNERDNKEIDVLTLEDSSVSAKNFSMISECKKANSKSINNGFSNVTTIPEEIGNKCNNDQSDLGRVDDEDGKAGLDCDDSVAVNNDNASNNTENAPVILAEESSDVKKELLKQNDLETNVVQGEDLKTDLLKEAGVKIDIVKDEDSKTHVNENTDMKTGSSERNEHDKRNALEDDTLREMPLETGEVSSGVSSKQNCEEEVKVMEDTVTPVDCDVQNGEIDSMSNDVASTKAVVNKEKEKPETPVEFTIGDIVWAQARGLPSWPGKIVDERDVGHGKVATDIGKKWVMWFGDHTFSQVEVEKLKTLTEGLKTLDDKGRKRKYRGKKTRIGLEQAIGEALEEIDQRERLRSRQGPKAKKRRL